MSFGKNVRYFRIRIGITLQELAEELGVSTNYLSTLENDNAKIKPDFLPRLCDALKIEIQDLYQKDETRNF